MIQSAKALFDAVGEKFASQFPRVLLRGDQASGYSPSQYGSVEQQGENYLSIKTATAETKGIPAGIGMQILAAFTALTLLLILVGLRGPEAFWSIWLGGGIALALFLWELYRPFPLPIIFNRRTREIYYDLNGKLYHIPWEGIEAVAYEYRHVNQYAGSMTHANLDLILHRFGDPEDCIALNIGGHTSGKHVETLAPLWEYLRAYMNEGPWFDEHGKHTAQKSSFMVEQLNKSGFTMRDELKNAKQRLAEAKQKKERVGAARGALWSAYAFHPMWFTQDMTYRICRDRADKQWPDVVRDRLDANGPTTRLVDIEADHPSVAILRAQKAALYPNQSTD